MYYLRRRLRHWKATATMKFLDITSPIIRDAVSAHSQIDVEGVEFSHLERDGPVSKLVPS